MPQMIEPLPMSPEPAPGRKRWTRQECDFLRDNGLLTERYELIDGEIISKMGQKPSHASTIQFVITWLISLFGTPHVRCQLPILIAENERSTNDPEPDAAVTALSSSAYIDRHPQADDLLLVAEVSDSTLRFDRTVKAALYARAGIVEYWVIDIAGRQIFVHRQPEPDGYADVTAYADDESVAPLARPNGSVRVADLLPPVVA